MKTHSLVRLRSVYLSDLDKLVLPVERPSRASKLAFLIRTASDFTRQVSVCTQTVKLDGHFPR